MGDPVGALVHTRATLAEDATVMVVEPNAGDRVDDNLNPVGRVYCAGSTFLCTPSSLAQPGARALGAQAGPERLGQVLTEAGFTRWATHIVAARGDEGVARIKDLTNGLGAHSVIEAVGTQESMMQAIRATRPGGHVGYVGVAHDVQLPGDELFFSHVHLHGGPAPVRRFLPHLIDLIWNREIDPGKVFDLALPLREVAEGYRAMDERRAIKTLLTV